MPATGQRTLRVKGLREMSRAFARADRTLSRELRDKLRDVAHPVASAAESLARSRISHIGHKWPRMRVGVTRTLVYVAPKERGVRSRTQAGLRRPNLADRLMEDAMAPALRDHGPRIERDTQQVLDTVGRAWER